MTGPNFTKGPDTCVGKQISVNGTCTVVVKFAATPTQIGAPRAGTLTVKAGGAAPVATFSLTGTPALAVVTVSAPAPALTSGSATATVKNGVITVSNATGNYPLTFAAKNAFAVNKAGAAGGTFTLTAPSSGTPCAPNGVVKPGASCTIGIKYNNPAKSAANAKAVVVLNYSGAAKSTTSINVNAN